MTGPAQSIPSLLSRTSKLQSIDNYPAGEIGVIDLGHRNFVRIMQAPNCFMHWHDCTGQGHISWSWFGNCGERQSGHKIISVDPLTVEGSLGCPRCPNHGYIRNGDWVPA